MPNPDRNGTVHVYLVESNPLASYYVLGLLAKDPQLRASDFQTITKLRIAEHAVSVFLLDSRELRLPLSECLRRLRTEHPGAKFVVMDQEESKENIIRMLLLGINGFVPYRDVPQFLAAAIHSVASGKMWVSREILTEYVQRTATLTRNGGSGFESLTFRENQIIELVKRRLSNKEIADILSIRESTVKFHLSNIFSKLQVSNRHALIDKDRGSADRALIFPDLAYSRA
ncbi:MAG: LuxR C-terminal-related transcriptional regulator [Terriglobia bacterium]